MPQAQRIRVIPPKKAFFSCNFVPTTAIASGLDIRIEVECLLPLTYTGTENVFEDFLTVLTSDFQVQVPIIAAKPLPDVQFISLIDFGQVVEGSTVNTSIQFHNQGKVNTIISIAKSSTCTFDPKEFELIPNASQNVLVMLNAEYSGSIRELIAVNISGQSTERFIDMHANIVTPRLILQSKKTNKILSMIDFGLHTYNSTITYDAILYNVSCIPIAYAVRFLHIESDNLDEDTTLINDEYKPFTVCPSEGVIGPNEQLNIHFTFQPIISTQSKGFMKKFLYEKAEPKLISLHAVIESVESGIVRGLSISVPLKLSGRALIPLISLTSTVLKFGVCNVGDRRDILFSVSSKSDLDVDFVFTSAPFFKFTPANGTLRAYQTLPIIATFSPSQLGVFNKRAHLSIANSVRIIDLKMSAEAIGITETKHIIEGIHLLPEDFKPKLKFIDPESVLRKKIESFHRLEPWNKEEEFLTSLSWNEDNSDKNFSYDCNGPVTYSKQELQRRANHKQVYNNYIEASYKKRIGLLHTHNEVNDRGLEEPFLSIPNADAEPLWMLSKGNDRTDATMPDENKLIIRKFPSVPQTQAEMKDCTLEVSAEEYKHIIASHKVRTELGKYANNCLL